MTDWNTIIDAAARHVPSRLGTTTMYLDSLQDIIGTPVQNWTDPFGRGYQYEFVLSEAPQEVSFMVELSVIANVAAAYLVRRTHKPDGSPYDECGDTLAGVDAGDLRQKVCSFLEKQAYDVIPYEEINTIRRGKLTYQWVFNDPED